MLILRNNTLCICNYGTIYNLIVIFISLNQPKREMRIFTNHIGPTQYSINNSLRNLRENVAG